MAGHEARLNKAIAQWIEICEEGDMPFSVIEAAQLAYDAGNDLEPSPELGCLRVLATCLFGFADRDAAAPADWEVIPLLMGRIAAAGFILGRQHRRSIVGGDAS